MSQPVPKAGSQSSSQVQPQYPPSSAPQLALPPSNSQTTTSTPTTPFYPQYPPYYYGAPGAYGKAGATPAYPYSPSVPTATTAAGQQAVYSYPGTATPGQTAYPAAQASYFYSSGGYLNSPLPNTPQGTQSPYAFGAQQQAQYPYSPHPTKTAPATTSTLAVPAPPSSSQQTVNAASGTAPAAARGTGRKPTTYKGAFTKDLRNMMYGFGDDPNPASDTVNVMEEILMEYISDICASSLKNSKRHTIKLEDLRRVLSRPADAKKLARMEELLFMQEDIKRARAQFNPEDDDLAAAAAAGDAGETKKV